MLATAILLKNSNVQNKDIRNLKQFKNQVNDIYLVDKRTSLLILWTERGASIHCKILDTKKMGSNFTTLFLSIL